MPEAQAPIATRAGGSGEGPEFVLRRTSLTSSIIILTTTMLFLLLLLLVVVAVAVVVIFTSILYTPYDMIIIVMILTVHSHVYHLA